LPANRRPASVAPDTVAIDRAGTRHGIGAVENGSRASPLLQRLSFPGVPLRFSGLGDNLLPTRQTLIRSTPWRCRETAPASVTSTVWPSVIACPLSEFTRIMWIKKAIPASITVGLPE